MPTPEEDEKDRKYRELVARYAAPQQTPEEVAQTRGIEEDKARNLLFAGLSESIGSAVGEGSPGAVRRTVEGRNKLLSGLIPRAKKDPLRQQKFAHELAGLREGDKVKRRQKELLAKQKRRKGERAEDKTHAEGLVNKRIGAAEEVAKTKVEEAGRVRDEKKVVQLRNEWLKNPITKDSASIAMAYRKIKASGDDPSAAGDLSLIFGFMKMLDPGSTVREGEQATAANARGVEASVRSLYNRVMTGEKLAGSQRDDFLRRANGIYEAQLESQRVVDKQYKRLAGASAEDVVLPLFTSSDISKQVVADSGAPPGVKGVTGSSIQGTGVKPQPVITLKRNNKGKLWKFVDGIKKTRVK